MAIAAPAGATPQGDLNSKQAQARALEASIEAAHQRAEVLNEQYLAAQLAAEDAQHKIADGERRLGVAEAKAEELRGRLSGRAAQLYMGAGNVDFISIDTTDARELGARAKYGDAAADTDRNLLDDLKVAEEQLKVERKDLERDKAGAQKRQHEADVALQEVRAATAQEERALAAVQGDIAGLVQRIADEKRRADEAEARRVAQQIAQRRAAEQAAARAAANTSSTSSTNGASSSIVVEVDPNVFSPAPNAGAAAAVDYARRQLGKPYRYAGTGPDAYDCSGLTMMAWAAGGVSMPHSSYAQAAMFPRVADTDLQPGDLAIYYGDRHHVGLYVGGGMTISATHTGSYVLAQPVFRSGFQFAVRPG